jgi:hypothetical protein
MLRVSFPWFPRPIVPRADRCKRALVAAAVLVLSGCGGAHGGTRIVAGTGYSFTAPADWKVVRFQRSVQVAHGVQLVSVTRFPLLHRLRPELWPKAVPEMDRSAEGLAADQHGAVVSRGTTTAAGQRARRYDIAYQRGGKKLTERVGFVLRGKTEYELLCRFERGKNASACETLFASFRLG